MMCDNILKPSFFLIGAHLLVPTVGDGENPLPVDEHAATEVITIVEGGHVGTSVRRTLMSANDPAIFTGNCRCNTHTHTHTQTQRERLTTIFHLLFEIADIAGHMHGCVLSYV